MALMLVSCSSDRLFLEDATSALQASNADMTGRWMLSAPDAPSCGMNFGGASGAREGVIEPDGGCPGTFFTSRHWTFEQGTLVIDDYDHKPLAHFTFANGRFAGQSTAGAPITLAR